MPVAETALLDAGVAARMPGAQARSVSYLQRRLLNALGLGLSDALAFCTALVAAGLLRQWIFGLPLVPEWGWYLLAPWLVGAALMRLLPSWGLGPVEELRRTTLLILLVFASTASVLFITQQAAEVSRFTIGLTFLFSIVLVPFFRLKAKRLLISLQVWGTPTVIYGDPTVGTRIASLLREERGLGYRPLALVDLRPDTEVHGDAVLASDPDLPIYRGARTLDRSVSVAILAMPGLSREEMIRMVEGPLAHYPTVVIIPDMESLPSLWVRPRDLNGMLGLEIRSNYMDPMSRAAKRLTDTALTLLTAPFWMPLCALIAFAIWLEDRHSPFFLQERIGRDGRIFRTFKFRTMYPKAEEILKLKLEEDAVLREEWNTFYKLRNDPRITRIGQFLRRSSLDELPQLINVLRGEMSLVGPRPLPAYHEAELPEAVRRLRSRVRPGITGLWQVSGRSDAGTEGMIQWDPYYVRNWSLWLDTVILVRTLRAVTQRSGAY